ncbi:hypothetical protein R3X25_10110 [Lutibacter sp. TH_r2]|uniref:hypothetical protein n=1 Tax=Lutibacter sp. TH_r2 TaxID=3082083 RepID=UPI00295570ED|nr:hypothetical protein [Lutibacter sp. TH_r2]MDV7187634.1 hypothetical protein [Lutibacter sp. TH_r2]
MQREYLDLYCRRIDFNEFYKLSTADNLFELQYQLQNLKSEILENKMSLGENALDYLKYVILQIRKWSEECGEENIKKINGFLDKYNTSLEDVLNFNISNDEFRLLFNKRMDVNDVDNDIVTTINVNFNSYFSNYYSELVIEFVEDLLNNKSIKLKTKKESIQLAKNTVEKNYVLNFGDKLSRYDNLAIEHNYFSYHNMYLLNYIDIVKEEIESRILELEPIKIQFYIDKVEEDIKSSGFQLIKTTILDKYVKKYNINVEELPEVNNKELEKILKINDYYQQIPYKEFSEIEFIQEQFYLYALKIETDKLLEHINSLKPKLGLTKSIDKIKQFQPSNLNPIFKDENGKLLFERIVHEFSLRKTLDAKQAKIMTMWNVGEIRQTIFKKHTKKKMFIEFINDEFEESYGGRSTSDSKNYHIDAEICLKNHLKELKK